MAPALVATLPLLHSCINFEGSRMSAVPDPVVRTPEGANGTVTVELASAFVNREGYAVVDGRVLNETGRTIEACSIDVALYDLHKPDQLLVAFTVDTLAPLPAWVGAQLGNGSTGSGGTQAHVGRTGSG